MTCEHLNVHDEQHDNGDGTVSNETICDDCGRVDGSAMALYR